MRGGPSDLAGIAEEIETTLTDGEFHVVPVGEGRVRIYYLDGKKHAREAPNGMKLTTISRMQGEKIVVEQEAENGPKVTETYEVSPDGKQMTLTVRLEGKRIKEPVIIRTVYDTIEDTEGL